MERIIHGIVFEGRAVPGSWDVRTWRRNGVVERSARQAIEWTEVRVDPDGLTAHGIDACGHVFGPREDTPEEVEEKRLRSLKKSAQRAKTMCRRVIITECFDELLTLTYRENQEDRELCKKHFGIWQKRMKRALGGFRFCASFEKQDRGAMHVHIATHRLPQNASYKGAQVKAWQVGTRIWRDIVGANNGLCFVGGKPKFGVPRRAKMTLAKMAQYVSKYIMKDFEDAPSESNRYSRSNGTNVGKPEHLRLDNCSVKDLIELVFECGEGDVLVDLRLNRWHDGLWLCTERSRIN
jgi:hypothetical protein